jgi:Alkylmercury lyase
VDIEDLRLAVYESFRDTGRAPDLARLALDFTASETEVRAGLDELARTRHLVRDDAGQILMAHPFSAVPLGFSVMGRRTLWWGGCCWDSFALAHLLDDEPDVLVATRCPGCDRAGAWVVDRRQPPDGEWLAHFLVPAAHMWDDVVHTCNNQRLFCSEECIDAWLERTGQDLGYVMDLDTLWRLASRWYEGRLGRGYVRREPAAASDYLRGAGLVGPFWGT